MDVSIIFATYKRPEILSRTLESFCNLRAKGVEWEVIVVDNAEDPATRDVVREYEKHLPIKFLVETTPGKNNALNRAIPEAQGELFIFTDDDVIADTNWLIEMWDGAKRWPNHILFGGRILPKWPDGCKPPSLNNPYIKGTYGIADWNISEGIYSANNVFGGNMAVRRKVFIDGWRFNPTIGPSPNKKYIMGSEAEFVLRLENAGFKAVYLPNALLLHQIRSEQMQFGWLKKRAFRAGLGQAAKDDMKEKLSYLLGMPRYLIRRLIETFVIYCLTIIVNSPQKQETGMRFWLLLGKLHQYRKRLSK